MSEIRLSIANITFTENTIFDRIFYFAAGMDGHLSVIVAFLLHFQLLLTRVLTLQILLSL